jgi:hypothetical protein
MYAVRGRASRATVSGVSSGVGNGSAPWSSVPAYTSLVDA